MKRKKKAGRPPIPGGIERITTTVRRGYKDRLATIGGGSVSAGIERLVDDYERRGVNKLADVQLA